MKTLVEISKEIKTASILMGDGTFSVCAIHLPTGKQKKVDYTIHPDRVSNLVHSCLVNSIARNYENLDNA